MQERRSSIANALELRLSCTNPSRYMLYLLLCLSFNGIMRYWTLSRLVLDAWFLVLKHFSEINFGALRLTQYHLIVQNYKISNLQVCHLDFSDCFDRHLGSIAAEACQIARQNNNLHYQSHGFNTSWYLTIRCPIRFWIRPLFPSI